MEEQEHKSNKDVQKKKEANDLQEWDEKDEVAIEKARQMVWVWKKKHKKRRGSMKKEWNGQGSRRKEDWG